MGVRNYLVEGVSGTGKTSVATELHRRGFHVIHGDRDLAYKGDPQTGRPIDTCAFGQQTLDVAFGHKHHIWDVDKVRSLISDQEHPVSFFCGGSRNFHQFVDLFDVVFVLDTDVNMLNKRLAARPWNEFGAKPNEREFIMRLHATKEDIPKGIAIDTTAPLASVVEELLSRCKDFG